MTSESSMEITSYLLLTVAPNVTRSVWGFAFHFKPEKVYQAFLYFYEISVRLSCTVDALIYIFIHPKIKQLIAKLICCSQNAQPQMEIPSGVQRARVRRHEEIELLELKTMNRTMAKLKV